MEEFRPVFCDRLVLSMINRQQVKPNGFTTDPGGGVRMDESTRKAIVSAYQKRKQEEVTHPFLDERMTLGLVPHIQARLLARHLRGDQDAYSKRIQIGLHVLGRWHVSLLGELVTIPVRKLYNRILGGRRLFVKGIVPESDARQPAPMSPWYLLTLA